MPKSKSIFIAVGRYEKQTSGPITYEGANILKFQNDNNIEKGVVSYSCDCVVRNVDPVNNTAQVVLTFVKDGVKTTPYIINVALNVRTRVYIPEVGRVIDCGIADLNDEPNATGERRRILDNEDANIIASIIDAKPVTMPPTPTEPNNN